MSDTVDKARAWDELAKKNAEIERLRAALTEIRDFPYVGAQASQRIVCIAREALGDEQDANNETK